MLPLHIVGPILRLLLTTERASTSRRFAREESMGSAARPILLIDDEPLMLDLLEAEFTDAGFDVVIAGRGAHALAEINANAFQFSAIVTDIALDPLDPLGSDGWEIALRARELAPEIPVIYVSGVSAAEWPSKGVPNSVMIAKPFAVGELIAAVILLLAEGDREALPQNPIPI
jgi:DNA-binding response OmpR family regulator